MSWLLFHCLAIPIRMFHIHSSYNTRPSRKDITTMYANKLSNGLVAHMKLKLATESELYVSI